ncbi:MAG: ATP-dependent zinc protease [Planctomycetaceae bacterium]
MARTRAKPEKSVIGWREWLSLPELGISRIKAKIDTGARSSCLHAFRIRLFTRDGEDYVSFQVHPLQRSTRETIVAECRVLECRQIRSSSGHVSMRPVIVTEVEWNGVRWPIELTLANRDAMGFRMLLGREAVRSRFVVDPGKSYLGGRPNRTKMS